MDFEVKVASIKDLNDIQKLNRIQCQREHEEFDSSIIPDWPFTAAGEKYFRDRITKHDGIIFIANVNDMPVGYLVARLAKVEIYRSLQKFAELETIYLLKKYRNHGIGSKMYAMFIEWCHEKGVRRVRTVTPVLNMKGIEFYKKNGFLDYYQVLEMEL